MSHITAVSQVSLKDLYINFCLFLFIQNIRLPPLLDQFIIIPQFTDHSEAVYYVALYQFLVVLHQLWLSRAEEGQSVWEIGLH